MTSTWDPEDLSQYASVIDPLGPGAAQLNLTSGVITGKPRTAIRKPHIVTVAGVRQDGNLALENPRIRSGPACSMMAGADACDRIHLGQVSDMSIF